jgi:pimeloyl-ACP methyl ester carboxylesterase
MSPIVLIHGNNSNAQFFSRQGLTAGLSTRGLLYDDSISMPTQSIEKHADLLQESLYKIAASFGVDSIHLVAHSKGGLDARKYLATYYRDEERFRVLSLVTLATPHNGSVLADVAMARDEAAKYHRFFDEFPAPSWLIEQLLAQFPADEGRPPLTTAACSTFNFGNIPALPRDVRFFGVGADADLSRNGTIGPGEFPGFLIESAGLSGINDWSTGVAASLIDVQYKILRFVRSVTVDKSETWTCEAFGERCETIRTAVIAAVGGGPPEDNDCFVTLRSALGHESYGQLVGDADDDLAEYVGQPVGADHAAIANSLRAVRIKEWVVETEREAGDLQ